MNEKRLQILSIESNQDDISAFEKHLEKSGMPGYELTACTSPEEGVKLIAGKDIVILSCHTSGQNDSGVIDDFMKNCPDVPVIILSDHHDLDTASASIKSGAQDFICRNTLNPEMLKRIITYTIERFRKTNELILKNRELTERENRIQLLVQSIDDPVLVTGMKGGIILSNHAAEMFFEKNTWEMKTLSSEKLFNSNAGRSSEISVTHEDGTVRHGIISTKTIRWEDKEVNLITVRDISERINYEKTIIQKEKYYRSILHKMHEDIIVIDSDSRIIDINNSVLHTTGFAKDMIIGQTFPDIFFRQGGSEDITFIRRAVNETFSRGKYHNFDMQFTDSSGDVKFIDVILSPINDGNSILYIAAALHDITEIVLSQKSLLEATSRLNLALKSANIGIWDYDVINNIVYNSSEWKNQLGYRDEELPDEIGLMEKLLHPDDVEKARWYMQSALENRISDYSVEFRLRHKNGSYVWVHSTAELYRDRNNRVIRMLGCHLDITQRKLNEEKFRMLFETMSQGVIYQDLEGIITEMNPAAEKIFGIDISTNLKSRLNLDVFRPVHENGSLFTREENPSNIAVKTGLTTGKIIMGITAMNTGTVHWLNVVGVPEFRPLETSPFRTYCTFEDITRDKDTQKILESSLREKEILLKEIHHRVKNNLQLISSMLGLQQRQIKDQSQKDLFIESQNRIKAIAIIHEKLYQSDDLSHINFRDYVQSYLNYLYQVYQHIAPDIKMENNIENIYMPVDVAIPCGLLINEITSNAFKHAFNGLDKGRIMINLSRKEDLYSIYISDDGVGLPDSFDISHPETLGMKLISAFIEQLDGKYVITKSPGTTYEITFNYGEIQNDR